MATKNVKGVKRADGDTYLYVDQAARTKIGTATLTTTAQDLSGAVNELKSGKADLDSSGKVPSSQLPTYPTVNDATLTIQKNGTNVATFTANSSTNATANITVPTALSGLTDDATHRLVTDTEKSTWNGKATTTDITNAINALDVSSVGGSGKYISAISETDGKISATATNMPTIPSFPLSAANGGTGKTSLNDAANALMNSLTEGTSDPTDNDYYISQYASGGTSTTTYHRRPVSKLWNYIKSKLATVATSGSYNDLSNKPTIPAAANNGTLTIQKNGTNVQTFTANQSTNVTANITVPTSLTGLTYARLSNKFGTSDEYTSGVSGDEPALQIYQKDDESSGIGFTGNGIYMWAPVDDTSLRFYNEDNGTIAWEIDNDSLFTGYIDSTHVHGCPVVYRHRITVYFKNRTNYLAAGGHFDAGSTKGYYIGFKRNLVNGTTSRLTTSDIMQGMTTTNYNESSNNHFWIDLITFNDNTSLNTLALLGKARWINFNDSLSSFGYAAAKAELLTANGEGLIMRSYGYRLCGAGESWINYGGAGYEYYIRLTDSMIKSISDTVTKLS